MIPNSLAGMIHKVGLLPNACDQQVPFAYKMYTRDDATGWAQSNAFKKTFSIDVDIHFVGVWLAFFNVYPSPFLTCIYFRDTVNSVGLIRRRLPFTASNTVISVFRHAISLDERRAKSKANLWNRPQPRQEELLSISDQTMAAAQAHDKGKSGVQHHKETLHALESKYGRNRAAPTDVEEVK